MQRKDSKNGVCVRFSGFPERPPAYKKDKSLFPSEPDYSGESSLSWTSVRAASASYPTGKNLSGPLDTKLHLGGSQGPPATRARARFRLRSSAGRAQRRQSSTRSRPSLTPWGKERDELSRDAGQDHRLRTEVSGPTDHHHEDTGGRGSTFSI